MKTISVKTSTSYDIIIQKNILAQTGKICAEKIGICKAAVITDSNVDRLYSTTLINSLTDAGYSVSKFVFNAGEESKNSETLINILEFLAQNELTRSDCVFALGGGVVGDIAGFASAVYLRGIRFIQIPTTLLAAVDSSVGGKTGIDLKAGKNLAGAFHQPSLVICDYSLLDSLPKNILSDGFAEVIKYGVINDITLFNTLAKDVEIDIENVISSCVRNKCNIVTEDEYDTGKRQLLNFGHTIGHTIEKLSNFTISHGSAVAIGMVIIMRACLKLGYCNDSELESLISLLHRFDLPVKCNYTASEIANVALNDKKRSGDTITLVIPHGIGDCRLLKLPITELKEFIEKGLTQ